MVGENDSKFKISLLDAKEWLTIEGLMLEVGLAISKKKRDTKKKKKR